MCGFLHKHLISKRPVLSVLIVALMSILIISAGLVYREKQKDYREIEHSIETEGELDIQSTDSEIGKAKPVGGFLLTITGVQRIPNIQARPYLNTFTDKDILVIDLLFAVGAECTKGCYVSTLITDYTLATTGGLLQENGEYSTRFYSAPFLHRKYIGNQALKTGQSGEHQAYFFIDADNKNFVFTYFDSKSGESQLYQLRFE